MRTPHPVVWAFAATVSITLAAQDSPRARYDSALEAWHAGNYPEALGQFQRLLKESTDDTFVEEIALLTGELYRTTEISPSDRLVPTAPKWSPDGRHFAFESTSSGRPSVHVYRLDANGPQALDPIAGANAVFSFDGARVAVIRSGPGPATLVERSLATGSETPIQVPAGTLAAVHYTTDDRMFVTAGTAPVTPGTPPLGAATQVFQVSASSAPIAVAKGSTPMRLIQALAGGRLLVSSGANTLAIVDPASGEQRTFEGAAPSASAGGDALVFMARAGNQVAIRVMQVGNASAPIDVKTTSLPLISPVISPDGRRVAYQMQPREDWELYVFDLDRRVERRVTNEIQHDHTPRFLTSGRLFGVIGEPRHLRSYVYDLESGRRQRLFHNNTLRTLSMERAWAMSADGTRALIVADRDGDTISPQRGVYLMDLTSRLGRQEILSRLERELAAETDLRERGRRMYTAIASQVQDVVRAASVRRIYEHERALGAFGSKDITQPGNQMAADYIHASLTSFGYTPEYQYFEAARGAGRSGIRTANVIATLRGTVHPELEYLVSSHYDSVAAGPGADDNTSGTSALLEAARILRGRPMPATIKFLWFTGEEAGLLGSREYVRQATARGDKVLGALNNDMVGFADDSRLDDTIRYSNPGLRDLQHAAAFQFTNLVTYDARYYQNTDAAAFFDAYGDVVAGIGSYPILGNPHYHTSHDTIDTVSFPLVTEVAKATTASIMLMASSPSRLKEVTATVKGTSAEVSWAPSPEKDVTAYLVRAWVNGQPRDTRVNGPRATIAGLRAGDAVWVKGVNQRGMEGWDWQRAVVK
jgi:Tol biopolymer transport system component